MERLTNKEEEIMRILWKLKKAFVKEVVAEMPEPKPHYNTVSTIIRNMEEKGFVSHRAFGNTYQYIPKISKEAYRKKFMQRTIQHYFENSYKNVVSFFAKEEKISADELREIIRLIEEKEKNNLMEYFIKSVAILVIFYLFYTFFLQKKTFFKENRYFLLSGLLASVAIPLITIKKYIQIPAANAFAPIKVSNIESVQTEVMDVQTIVWFIYLSGIVILSAVFLSRLIALISFLRKSKPVKKDGYYFIDTDKNTSPFSFFHFIVINKNNFSEKAFQSILLHEKAHAKQWHSIDNLIIQVFSIAFWFNPFVWLYRNEMLKNLEYLADSEVLHQTDHKSYQYLMLKTAAPAFNRSLTSPFYDSLIKNRIKMIQQKPTAKRNRYTYLLMIPVLIAFIFMFNTEVIAQEKKTVESVIEVPFKIPDVVGTITKNTTKTDLKFLKKSLKEKGIKFKYRKIRRNKKGEITRISISLKNKTGNMAKADQDSSIPITNIDIMFDEDSGAMGVRNAVRPGEEVYEVPMDESQSKKIHTKHVSSGFTADSITQTKNGTLYIFGANENGDIHADQKMKHIIRKDDKQIEIIEKNEVALQNRKTIIYTSNKKTPLFILNGTLISEKEANKIDPNNIKQISVIKGAAADKKHGDKATKGVVEIITK